MWTEIEDDVNVYGAATEENTQRYITIEQEAVADIIEWLGTNIIVNDMPLGQMLQGMDVSMLRAEPMQMSISSDSLAANKSMMAVLDPEDITELAEIGQKVVEASYEQRMAELRSLYDEVSALAGQADQIQAGITEKIANRTEEVVETIIETAMETSAAVNDTIAEAVAAVDPVFAEIADKVGDRHEEAYNSLEDIKESVSMAGENVEATDSGNPYVSFTIGAASVAAIVGVYTFVTRKEQKKNVLLESDHFMSA